jgi:AcrR family transcriptional regulator
MQSGTARGRAKAQRRTALTNAAVSLFASRGFTDTPLEEIGSAAGVSGPAVYRHFENKQAVLAAILVEVSTYLLAGGQAVLDQQLDPVATIEALVDFHVTFAIQRAEVIRIQDHDLDKLSESDRHAVRAAQRAYVEIWVDVLAKIHSGEPPAARRTRAHAAFGLMNSTPYSAGRGQHTRSVIQSMTLAALQAPLR